MHSAKILLVSGFMVVTAGAVAICGTANSAQKQIQNKGATWLADGSDPLPRPNPPMLVADGSDPLPRPNPPILVADGSDPLPRPNPPIAA